MVSAAQDVARRLLALLRAASEAAKAPLPRPSCSTPTPGHGPALGPPTAPANAANGEPVAGRVQAGSSSGSTPHLGLGKDAAPGAAAVAGTGTQSAATLVRLTLGMPAAAAACLASHIARLSGGATGPSGGGGGGGSGGGSLTPTQAASRVTRGCSAAASPYGSSSSGATPRGTQTRAQARTLTAATVAAAAAAAAAAADACGTLGHAQGGGLRLAVDLVAAALEWASSVCMQLVRCQSEAGQLLAADAGEGAAVSGAPAGRGVGGSAGSSSADHAAAGAAAHGAGGRGDSSSVLHGAVVAAAGSLAEVLDAVPGVLQPLAAAAVADGDVPEPLSLLGLLTGPLQAVVADALPQLGSVGGGAKDCRAGAGAGAVLLAAGKVEVAAALALAAVVDCLCLARRRGRDVTQQVDAMAALLEACLRWGCGSGDTRGLVGAAWSHTAFAPAVQSTPYARDALTITAP